MATPQSVRYLNEITALNALFRSGGMSRADLARLLGLNRSTTGNIIAALIADGLAIERPDEARADGPARSGRPGIRIELLADGAIFLGAEIGVDRLAVAAVDIAAQPMRCDVIRFHTARQTPEAVSDLIVGMIAGVVSSLPDAGRVRGLCLALPALVRDGRLVNAPMLGWHHHVPIDDLVAERLARQLPGLPIAVEVENDANAFAIAETYRDAAEPSRTVAALLIESGAGGGIVIGGRLFRGATGLAGAFGHLTVAGEGTAAGRLRGGPLESQIGKEALLARYRASGATATAGLPDFLAALAAGEAAAIRTASEWGRSLAIGLVQITSVLNPDLIVLGGALAPVFRAVSDEVEAAMRLGLPEGFTQPRVALSSLGPEAAAIGGALIVHQHMFSIDERAIHQSAQPVSLFRA